MSNAARRDFDETVVPAGWGPREESIHQASGLRCKGFFWSTGTVFTAVTGGSGSFGGVAGAAVSEWTGLRAGFSGWDPKMSAPMTPTIFMTVADVGSRVRFKLRGLDQFGNAIVEVTPWIALNVDIVGSPPGQNLRVLHAINVSKVFSTVEEIEYMSTGVNVATGAISAGYSAIIDPSRVAAAQLTDSSNTNIQLYGTEQNWGIGTPLRISPYGPAEPFAVFEVFGAGGINFDDDGARALFLPHQAGRSLLGYNSAGYRLGRSLSGWQGTPHKLGFHSDDWTAERLGIETGGSSVVSGDVPTTLGQVGQDFLMMVFWMRSTLGTRRDHNPTSVYDKE